MCGIRSEQQYKTKVLKIIDCSDPAYWYADMIDKYVPYIRELPSESVYLSREIEGYTNIVKICDAELVELDADSYKYY